MKSFNTLLIIIIFSFSISAQQAGTIKYAETTKLEFEGMAGLDLGDMMPSEMNTNKELFFGNMVSVYKDAADNTTEDIKLESDDGSFQMVIETSDSEEILYTDLKAKESINQTAFMSKEFLIEEKLSRPKWKISNERIKYLGYVCQKATYVKTIEPMKGTEEEAKEMSIVAWFTSEIAVPIGPSGYNQLPGAILMVSIDDGRIEIKATEVSLDAPDESMLVKPTKGQKVSKEEYDDIMAEKIKEMQKMSGNREGRSIMIRG